VQNSKFGHNLRGVLLLPNLRFLSLPLCLVCAQFALRHRHLHAFAEPGELLEELFAATTEQESVLVALLSQQLSVLSAVPLVDHVDYYQLVRLVFKAV